MTATAAAEESVLVALERAGVSPRAYCRSGSCGYCRSRLLSGEVWTDPDRAPAPTDGVFHPCCSFHVAMRITIFCHQIAHYSAPPKIMLIPNQSNYQHTKFPSQSL